MNRTKQAAIISLLFLTALVVSCKEEGRIDQIDEGVPAPQAVTIKGIENRPGGAVIRYTIPDDDRIIGIKVVYVRNGQTCENMSSRFVDSLKIEGFGDTGEKKATVYSIGANGKLSGGVPISFSPLTAPVKSVSFDISETFGGIAVAVQGNSSEAQLAAVLLRDSLLADNGKTPGEIQWDEFYTFHLTTEKANLARRGMESRTMLYGVYLRDRWNNTSDTLYRELTPIEEIRLPVTTWRNAALPTDSWEPFQGLYNWYDISHLWDGNLHGDANMFASTMGPKVKWITIDLGYTAKLSRMQMFHRDSDLYSGAAPRHFQVWGSMNPNPDGSWDDSWYLLGDFEPYKPSGYQEDGSVGTITDEDRDYWVNTNEYVFEITEEIPNPYRETRFIRLKLIDNFSTYGVETDYELQTFYTMGEIILHGQMPLQSERDMYYTN